MAERDVVIKVKGKTDPSAEKALQDLARRAKETESATAKAGKAMQQVVNPELTRQIQAQTKALDERNKATAKPTPASKPATPLGAAGGGVAGQALGVFGLGQFGGLAGPLAAVAGALKGLEVTVKLLETSFERGRFSTDKFYDSIVKASTEIPLVGKIFAQSREAQAIAERERSINELVALNQKEGALQGTRSGFLSQQRTAALSLGQAQQLVGNSGLGLSSDQSLSRAAGLSQAETLFAGAQVRQQQQLLQASHQSAESLRKQLSAPGLTEEQELKRRLQLEGELIRQQQILRDLQTAQETSLGSQQKHYETLLQLGQARVQQLQQQKEIAIQTAQAEKDRLSGSAEQFGFLSPLERKQALLVGRKLEKGGAGGLSGEELSFARGLSIFQPILAQQAKQLGGTSPEFRELVRILGADAKLKQAEATQVAINNQIAVELKLNESALATQLQQQVIPKIHEMLATIRAQILADLERQRLQAKNNQSAVFKG